MTAYAEPVDLPALLIPADDRLSRAIGPALLGALLVHGVLLFAVAFVPPGPKPAPETSLEVLILKETGQATDHPSPSAMLSQRDRVGESVSGDAAVTTYEPSEPAQPDQGPTEPTAETSAVEPPPTETSPPLHSAVPERPEAKPEITTSLIPVQKTAPVLSTELDTQMEPLPATDALQETETRIDAAQILASRGREIARLTASLEARSDAYARRVRRKSISASTREFKYASYLGAWARKVERIGNINYPQAAKDQRLYGSLILHVAVRSDGSVERIRVVKSSGYDLLDQAAVQIVELAAPYSPFPPDIAAETDALDIIRTWQFMRGDVLGWER